MAKIIAFEGMPGTGKTTALLGIERLHYFKDSAFVPQLDIHNTREGLRASKTYLDAEVERSRSIENLTKSHQYLFLDRTFITTLAYCYARSKVQNRPGQFVELKEYFRKLDSKFHFLRPAQIIYFDISISQSIARRLPFSNDKQYRYWFNGLFLEYFKEFYLSDLSGLEVPLPTVFNAGVSGKNILVENLIKVIK